MKKERPEALFFESYGISTCRPSVPTGKLRNQVTKYVEFSRVS